MHVHRTHSAKPKSALHIFRAQRLHSRDAEARCVQPVRTGVIFPVRTGHPRTRATRAREGRAEKACRAMLFRRPGRASGQCAPVTRAHWPHG